MNREEKQESSVPAQSRVSIVTLAQLAKYWQNEDYHIRTVSQLISWSLELLKEALVANGHIEGEPSIEEARHYMMKEKLFQQGTLARGKDKLNTAIRFDRIRKRGGDPRSNESDRAIHNRLHRKHNQFTGEASSVEPFMDSVSGANNELIKNAMETYEKVLSGEIETKHVLSREYELRNESMGEIEALKEKASPDEVAEHMKKVERKAEEQLRALKEVDLEELSTGAVKE